MNLLKRSIAEGIGTAVLVFAACGIAVISGNTVGIALGFGLVIVAMAYSIGNVSGCHINPAVSLAMLITKRMTLKEFLCYVGAQVVGAFVGATLLGLCLRGNFDVLGGNTLSGALLNDSLRLDGWSYFGGFLVEMLLTFIFVIAVLGVTDSKFKNGKIAGIVIGLTLALVHLFGLGFTGTSVNPARSIAPAIIQAIAGDTTSLEQVWIWILAPLAGAALAAVVYTFLTKSKKENDTEAIQ